MTVSEELINLCPDYDCRHFQPNRGKPWENIAEQRRKPTLNSSDINAGVDPEQRWCDKQLLSHQNAFLVCPALHGGKGEG